MYVLAQNTYNGELEELCGREMQWRDVEISICAPRREFKYVRTVNKNCATIDKQEKAFYHYATHH